MASRTAGTLASPKGNHLNRSMQSQWSSLRKLNLNTQSPSSEPVCAATTSTISTEVTEQGLDVSQVPSSMDIKTGIDSQQEVARKRKSVSTREENPSKRPKVIPTERLPIPKNDYSPPSTRLSDLGGVRECVERMMELVAMPIRHPEIYLHTGVHPPRGVLLHGPPGCGKTLLANAIAGELQVPFISVSAPSIVSGMSGESEKTLREMFDEAKKIAPCLIFIDEIDAITPKRESAQREMERRIVAQFLTCMDDLSWDKTNNKPVVIIGATNRPDSLDAALRRAGRFDHEISMNVPDEESRVQILQVLCSKLRLAGNFDFRALAKSTPGYVGADLAALTGAAGVIAVKRIFHEIAAAEKQASGLPNDFENNGMAVDSQNTLADMEALNATNPFPLGSIANFLLAHPEPLTSSQLEPIYISFSDFIDALPTVQPSAKREGFATIPNVTWSDVGALKSIRSELQMSIVQPIKFPELFKSVGIDAPSGVLLWGPPGCGKTLLAKAVASESRANFISVKGPELLNKYVGESERAVRQVFSRARASSPCIIFFDELDALVPRRDDSLSESSARVVNTLLTELDGLDSRHGVHVIGATNRPDMIDPAMCRPGRLDKLLFVDLPDGEERVDIFDALVRRLPIAAGNDVNVRELVAMLVRRECDGFSGADLAALVREAGVVALRRSLPFNSTDLSMELSDQQLPVVQVFLDDFKVALKKIGPSVTPAQRRKYNNLRSKFSGATVPVIKVHEEEPQ